MKTPTLNLALTRVTRVVSFLLYFFIRFGNLKNRVFYTALQSDEFINSETNIPVINHHTLTKETIRMCTIFFMCVHEHARVSSCV